MWEGRGAGIFGMGRELVDTKSSRIVNEFFCNCF